MWNDLINGSFEFMGAAFILMNIRALVRDRHIKGVHWGPVVFFTTWGLWNLWYYPSLHQWFSFTGGSVLASANITWLYLLWRFSKN